MSQSEEANRLLSELQFLVDDFGFVQTTPEVDERWQGVRTSYLSPQFRIAASYNYRDDHDIALAYPSRPGTFSIATLVSALQHEQRAANWPRLQVSFLRANLEILQHLPSPVIDDCLALRFYHAPDWRKSWGTTIQMSPNEIAAEQERLERLRAFFGQMGGD